MDEIRPDVSGVSIPAACSVEPAELQNDQIYARIFQSIVDHRLVPGTHLKEDEIGEVFGIGRTRVRAILARLAADHVVELVANRGAFVAKPTIEEAREVFRARRVIESHLVRRVAESAGGKAHHALEHHLVEEESARQAGDQSAVIKRCGNFHQVLADQADSPIMARFLRELIARSSLIIAVHESRAPDARELEEHRALADLVLAGRGDEAVALMERHLCDIESRLDLRPKPAVKESLRAKLLGTR